MSFGTTGPNWQDESMPNGDSPEEVVELLHEDESSEPAEGQISSAEASDAEPLSTMDLARAPSRQPYDASESAQSANDYDHQNAIDALRALDQLRSERNTREYANDSDNAFANSNTDAVDDSLVDDDIHRSTTDSLYHESRSQINKLTDDVNFEGESDEVSGAEDEVMHNDDDEEEDGGYDLTNDNYGADDVGDDGSDDISNESEAGVELDAAHASAPTFAPETNRSADGLYSDGAISVDVRNEIPGMADHVEFPRSRANSPPTSLFHSALSTESRPSRHQSPSGADNELLLSVANLKDQIRDLEATQWNLERQLHHVELQHESARQEQRRYAQLAEDEASSLRQLRSTSAQDKARYEARIVELQVAANNAQSSAQSAERSLLTLRERFNQQTDVLSELRERFNQAERKQIEYESQSKTAKQAESRAQRQLELLRSQLNIALEDAAAARADLDIQVQSLAEMRAEARAEALAAIAQEVPGSEANDEQVWRKQYIALRREMDAVAAEFERQEPEIAALQKAYDEAQTQLTEYQANLSQCQSEQHQLEEKLQLSEHRTMDLMVFQQLSETQLNDLRRQVLVLLTEKALNAVGSPPLTPEDEDELMRLRAAVARIDNETSAESESADAGKLITERLLLFRDVAELQLQNESLLKACRELALQLDPESQAKNGALQLWETQKNNDLLRATEALEELEGKFSEIKEQLLNERDSRRVAEVSVTAKEEEVNRLRKRILEVEGQYQAAMQSFADHSAPAGFNSNAAVTADKEEKLLRLQLSTLEERINDMRQEVAQYRDDHRDLVQDLTTARATTARAEEKLANTQQTVADLRAQLANEQRRNAVLQQENQMVAQREQQLIAQLSQAQTDLVDFKRKISSLQQDLTQFHSQQHTEGSSNGDTINHDSRLEKRLEEQIQGLRALITSQSSAQGQITTDTTELVAAQEARDDAVRRAEEAVLRAEKASARVHDLEQQIAELKTKLSELDTQAAEAARTVEFERQQAAKRLHTQSTEAAKTLAEKDQVIAKMKDREVELVQQINDVEDQVTEAADKADETIRELKLQLDQETEKANGLKLQLDETRNREDELAKIREDLATKLRVEIENELKQSLGVEPRKDAETENSENNKTGFEASQADSRPASAEDVKDVPAGDVLALKCALSDYVETEVLDILERDIENREHAKTQAYFLQQLQETKEASFKEGQDSALKQNEARKKLQQKQSEKLKQQIETLQAEIEAQKKTIRRLKFGTEGNNDSKTPSEEEPAPSTEHRDNSSAFGAAPAFSSGFNFNAPLFTPQQSVHQHQQHSDLPQEQNQEQQIPQPPSSSFGFSQGAFSNPSSSFGSAFTSFNNKRTGPFEDSEAKKRRED